MSSVDERIVKMEFDNAKFENGVSTSIKSIDKLKQALDFSKQEKAFAPISNAANQVDLSNIQNGIDQILNKFSIANTAFRAEMVKLVDWAVGKGKQLADALFIAPRKQGFEEYELKMGSVQTIMASTGATLEEVNGYLEDLNRYADKTIYSFSDMTANIGKFTNAGVDLQTAVKAIQGISNEAAISGANSAEASRAMYNFAQALSSGAVKLIDWKSIENANMATVEFKQNLIDTALELGTVVQEGDKYRSVTADASGKISDAFNATSMFNESLSHQWMTTEVLTKTLGKYADETTELGKKAFAAAQDVKTWSQLLDTLKEAVGSGWSQSFEIIIGDFNEAKELFTAISNTVGDIINKVATIRNGFLKMWDDNGGREKLIKGLDRILKQIDILSDKLAKSFLGSKYNKIFGDFNDDLEKTSELIDGITKKEKEAAWDIWLKGAYGTGEERKRQLEDMGLSYENVQAYIDKIVSGTASQADLEEQIAEDTGEAKENIETIADTKWSRSFDNVLIVMKNLGAALKNVGTGIWNIVKIFVDAFIKEFDIEGITYDLRGMSRMLIQITGRFKKWTEESQGLRSVATFLVHALNKAWQFIKPIVSFVLSAVDKIAKGIFSVSKRFTDIANGVDQNSRLYRAIVAIKTIVGKVKDAFIDAFDRISDAAEANPKLQALKDWFDKLKESAEKFIDSGFTGIVEWLEKIAAGDISFDALVDFVKSFGDGESKVGGFFSKLKEGLGNISIFDGAFDKIKAHLSDDSIKDVGQRAYLFALGLGNGIMSALKEIDWEKVMNIMKFGAFMAVMYQAYAVLTSVKNIASNFNGAIIGVINSVANTIASFQSLIRAKAIKEIAESVAILAGTLIALCLVPTNTLKEVTSSISAVIFALALLAKYTNSGKLIGNTEAINFDSTMLGIAGMMLAMYAILKLFIDSNVDVKTALSAVGVLYLAMLSLASFLAIVVFISERSNDALPSVSKAMKQLSKTLLIMGVALGVVSWIVDNYSDSVLAAVGIMGLMALILAALAAVSLIPGMERLTSFSLGLMLLSVAIGLLTPSLMALTLLDPMKLLKVIGCLSLLLLVLGVMAKYTRGSKMMSFAAGLFLIGAAMVYLGKNIIFAIPGLIALAGAMVVLGILGALGSLVAPQIMVFGQALMWVSGALLVGAVAFLIFAVALQKVADACPTLAEGIVTLANKIVGNAPLIGSAIEVVILAMTDALAKSTPSILKGIRKLLDEVGKFIFSPTHGIAGLLLDVLEGLAEMLAGIIGRLVDIFLAFITDTLYELGDALEKNKGELANAVEYFVAAFTNTLITIFAAIVDGVVNGILGKFGVNLNLTDKVASEISKGTSEMKKGTSSALGDAKKSLKDVEIAGKEYGEDYGEALADGVASGVVSKQDFMNQLVSDEWSNKGGNQITMNLGSAYASYSNIDVDTNELEKRLTEMGENGSIAYGDGFINGFTFDPKDQAAFDSYIDNYEDVDLGAIGFGAAGDYTNGFTNGFEDNLFSFDTTDVMTDWSNEFKQPDEFEEVGSDNAKSFTNGLEENRGPIRRKATQLANTAKEVFENKKPEYYQAGIDSMQGFIEGINHKSEDVKATVELMAEKIKMAFSGRKGLDEHSPSKVFDSYGVYATEGFINGLLRYSQKVYDSTTDMAESAVSALTYPLDYINSIMNDTLTVDPTIRPVMDLSDIQANSQLIDGMFANRTVALAGVNAKLNNMTVDANLRDKRSANDNVVNEIKLLRAEMNTMSERLDGMQVVMDTGALVGSISSPMDSALGQRAIRKGRRN